MRRVKQIIVATLMALGLAGGLVVAETPPASAQGFDYYDYGWVQGYYGGVHIYVYDGCHYTSGAGLKNCLEIHYDHHIVASNTVVPDADYLPAGMWIGSIQPGQYAVGGLVIRWVPRDSWATPDGHTFWYPQDDPSSCAPSAPVCGLNSDGELNQGSSGIYILGGNTAHARIYQNNINRVYTNGTGNWWRAETNLF